MPLSILTRAGAVCSEKLLIALPILFLANAGCERRPAPTPTPAPPLPPTAKLAAPTGNVLQSDGTAQDIQRIHDQAHDGDTITIPAGTFS
jgi:hypothetical protein